MTRRDLLAKANRLAADARNLDARAILAHASGNTTAAQVARQGRDALRMASHAAFADARRTGGRS